MGRGEGTGKRVYHLDKELTHGFERGDAGEGGRDNLIAALNGD